MPARSLPEGTAIADYRLLGSLGTGSMGEVYEARHEPTGRHVAIKVLREDTEEAANAGRRLLEEARAVIAIRHPGIVVVSDVGLLKGERRPYLVMELLRGVPLSTHLKKRRMPVPEAVGIIGGILDALGAAHRAGVVHRDLKPSNVFIVDPDTAPKVKLLDFGVARREGRTEALTGPAMAVGSMGFMAPEQLMGQAVASSDLYAVGCIAFLLLAGRPVFPLKNIPDNTRSHFSEPPPKLRSARPELGVGLEAWVDRLLQKKPAERYPSAVAALAALRALDSPRTELVTAHVPLESSMRPTDSETRIGGDTDEEPGKTLIDS